MWGFGSALGVLAILGYIVFVCGAVLLWLNRGDVPTWLHDEVGALKRKAARKAVYGPGHGLREEVTCTACPHVSLAGSPGLPGVASIGERFSSL